MRQDIATHRVRTISVTIHAPLDEAYAFARQPANFMRWAAGLAGSLHESEHGWIARTPEGEAEVTFTQPNAHGVLDHHVRLPGKPDIYIPLRMIANGQGTEIVFTLFRQPDMTDAQFDADEAAVRRDLETLKALLESGEASEAGDHLADRSGTVEPM